TGDLKLCVTNSHDMRYRITEIKDEPVIENYSRNKGIFCIPEDCDAFMVSDRHVDIMLDTEFGRAVSRIAKETADE
ncbi:MAG: hypothetical protein MJ171_07650, partial [Clostridia bacterium]|nr:hypothetical protein [Clostridia bacterium]